MRIAGYKLYDTLKREWKWETVGLELEHGRARVALISVAAASATALCPAMSRRTCVRQPQCHACPGPRSLFSRNHALQDCDAL